MNISQIIAELTKGYHIPSKGCSCGCNTCHLPESKSFNKQLKTIINEKLSTIKVKESYKPESVVKIEGILVTNITDRNQEEILSDIRSIAGITIVSSEKVQSNANYSSDYFKSKLKIKIDPHPFVGKGGYGKEQLKNTILDIKKVKGVRNFKLITQPKTQTI